MNAIRISASWITELAANEIFVFGSNLQGQHCNGAAKLAHQKFGAQWGVGVGFCGQTYAIPTMHGGLSTIKPYVDQFIEFARNHNEFIFFVTEIGCGIAGFSPAEIAPLFRPAITANIPNIYLPESFYKFY